MTDERRPDPRTPDPLVVALRLAIREVAAARVQRRANLRPMDGGKR